MAPPERYALAVEKVAQHPAARERIIVEMQFIEPPHDLQIRGRHRSRLGVDGAPADPDPSRKSCADDRIQLSIALSLIMN